MSLTQGSTFTFTCQAVGGNPPANITWVVGSTELTHLPQIESPNVVEELWDTSSDLSILPDLPHHNERLQCITSVPAGPRITLFVILDVQGIN